MKFNYKKYLSSILIILILVIIQCLITNTLYYYDVINNNLVKYFKMFIAIDSFLIGGINLGLNSPNKGYLYGLKLSLFMIMIFLIISVIVNNLKITNIIYYLITTICITFGAMIGINKKKV